MRCALRRQENPNIWLVVTFDQYNCSVSKSQKHQSLINMIEPCLDVEVTFGESYMCSRMLGAKYLIPVWEAELCKVLKRIMDAVSLTLPFLPNYISSITIFSEARPRNMDFPTGKKYGRLWHFQSIDRGFSTAPLHRCRIKLVNLDFYVSNFLAF